MIHRDDVELLKTVNNRKVVAVLTTKEVVTLVFENGCQLELSDMGEQGWSLWVLKRNHS